MLCFSAHIDFFASLDLCIAGFVGRRTAGKSARPEEAFVSSAAPAPDLRFGGVVGSSWFLRAAGDFPNDASELPGGNTGRCGAGSVLQFVCCVFGVVPNAKMRRFGIWGVWGSSQHHLQ
jgi:hypothetical protein